MKNFWALFISLLLISSPGITQWSWQYPKPQGNRINGLTFHASSGKGYAVGDHGSVIHTPDKGLTWVLLDSVTPHNLNSVHLIANNKGYAVGDFGTILRLNDMGAWVSEESGVFYNLFGVALRDESNVFAVGYQGLILKKDGNGWSPVSSGTTRSLYSIAFANPETAIIVGDTGLIILSTNSGQNWTKITTEFNNPLNDVFFVSETVGYIAGNGGIVLKTTNGGQNWINISHPSISNNLFSVHFFDENNGFVSGASGSLMTTTNGGGSWAVKTSGTDLPLNAVHLFNARNDVDCDTIVVCGHNGIILRTIACDSLNNISKGSSASLSGIHFINTEKGFAVGGDLFNNKPLLLRTADGANWEQLKVDTITRYLTDLFFLNNDFGYISGNNGNIYRTNDGGENWIPLPTGVTKMLYSVRFISPSLGFAVGAQGTFIKTISGDTIWQTISTGTTKNLYALYYKNSIEGGYAVGDQGTIIRIRNNGNLVTNIPTGIAQALYGVYFPTDTVGFAVGYNGRILKIRDDDGQYEITTIPSGVTTPLNKVFFPSPEIGYIAGEGGVVLKSTDGGNTWFPQVSRTSNNLRALFFQDNLIGYVAGSGSAILYTTIGGGQVILPFIPEAEAPLADFKLFPNPASNIVWIEYELTSPSPLTIKVFDFSGRIVQEIQSVEYGDGNQKQQVDISRLQGGIYLLMVQAGSQQLVEKLIILK